MVRTEWSVREGFQGERTSELQIRGGRMLPLILSQQLYKGMDCRD